jgi:hypothetical protein
LLVQFGYEAGAAPKLDILAVNELLRPCNGIRIFLEFEGPKTGNVSVAGDHEGAIFYRCVTVRAKYAWIIPHVCGVPVFSKLETAVTSCAGAKGFPKRMLFGTPCTAH